MWVVFILICGAAGFFTAYSGRKGTASRVLMVVAVLEGWMVIYVVAALLLGSGLNQAFALVAAGLLAFDGAVVAIVFCLGLGVGRIVRTRHPPARPLPIAHPAPAVVAGIDLAGVRPGRRRPAPGPPDPRAELMAVLAERAEHARAEVTARTR